MILQKVFKMCTFVNLPGFQVVFCKPRILDALLLDRNFVKKSRLEYKLSIKNLFQRYT